MKIKVREANTGDAGKIAEVYVTSWRATYADIIPEPLLNALSIRELALEWTSKIESENEFIFVAESDAGIIGFAHIGSNKDEDLADETLETVELHALYFHPSTINQGFGTQMWGIIEESLIGKLVVLWALESNNSAHHFYIKHGFEQDVIPGEYAFQGQLFPKVRYRKLVN